MFILLKHMKVLDAPTINHSCCSCTNKNAVDHLAVLYSHHEMRPRRQPVYLRRVFSEDYRLWYDYSDFFYTSKTFHDPVKRPRILLGRAIVPNILDVPDGARALAAPRKTPTVGGGIVVRRCRALERHARRSSTCVSSRVRPVAHCPEQCGTVEFGGN
jgi:hypothetical protein